MKVRIIAVGAFMGLSACAGGSLTTVQQSCSALPRYPAMWDCIKAEIGANKAGAMNNDLGLRYMAVGEALREQVVNAKITDAQAKMALSTELVRGNEQYRARYSGGPVVCNSIGNTVICN